MTPAAPSATLRVFGIALALPFVVVAGLAIPAAFFPARLGWAGDLDTLIGVGIASCLAGSLMLYRALRTARAPWTIVLIAYDVAMPLAVIGMAFLAVAARDGW